MTDKDHILSVELVEPTATFTLREICERGDCHAEFVIKLVSYGVIAPVEETAPDPVDELHKAGLVRKGFTPEVIETPSELDEAPSPDEANEADESPQETAPRRGFRVIEGGKD